MDNKKIANILTFLKRSKELESVERYGVSLSGKQNTVAEHSWRLALMVLVIGGEVNVQMDMGRALSLALVHDLAEAKTGDIDAYTQIVEGEQVVKDKAILEELAMHEITDDLSFGDKIYSLWREYEDQVTIESKFVQALDGIEGFLHIAEDKVGVYIPKEFHGDYADKAVRAFDNAVRDVPELMGFLSVIKNDLRKQFEMAGVKWVEGA